jgi:hypothetical protein
MVILKLNTQETAQDIAYMLRGKCFGHYVVLLKHDQSAIDLAVDLTSGKLTQQLCVGAIVLVTVSLVTCHGLLSFLLWSNPLGQRSLESESSLPKASPSMSH